MDGSRGLRTVAAAAGVVLLTLLGVGCTGDGDPGDVEATAVPEPTDVSERPDAVGLVADELEGSPPGQLQVRDVVEGDGAEVTVGSRLTVQYVGLAWSTGEEFDASWERNQPFTFELGAGRVIEGWERGVEGMREGGRRLLVVPPELGYGDAGVPGAIEGGETLVFVVDLLAVEPGS